MQETYTFSRALHLMRYSGAKMKPCHYNDGYFFIIDKKELCYQDSFANDLNRSCDVSSDEIMGSWVEVK